MNYGRTNQDGLVEEVFDLASGEDIKDYFPSQLGFVAVPAAVKPGWRLTGDKYVAPKVTAADLLARKVIAKKRVVGFADAITDTIMSAYPKAEITSWAEQASQARRVVNGGETLGANELLTKLAAKSGDTVTVYAASVLAKAASFEAITVEVKSLRDQSETAIDAVTDIADIEPLLMTLKAQAEATAVTLGIVL